MSLTAQLTKMGQEARFAARKLARLGSDAMNEALHLMAAAILDSRALLQEANAIDLAAAKEAGITAAMLDRLTLSDAVIDSMAEGIREVAAQEDPVGEVTRMWKRPNGLIIGKKRIPLGVIGIIYESRPNVTADAAALCLKAGNATILRGGKEAINSNRAIAKILTEALAKAGIPAGAIQVVSTISREAVVEMLKLEEYIDLIIPRGGEGLIRFVSENSRIPVVKHYKGVCHLYVDDSADLEMAEAITINAKVQRPGVCNSIETLLVHSDHARGFLPAIIEKLQGYNVEIRGCKRTQSLVPGVIAATEVDWDTEYVDLIISVKVVDSIDEAMDHIDRWSSLHTESIITTNYANSQRFLEEVNSSVVMVNASTRFSDGQQFGLGAEIGISTTKIHSFGPMGAEDLTTTKFIVYGQGQIRE